MCPIIWLVFTNEALDSWYKDGEARCSSSRNSEVRWKNLEKLWELAHLPAQELVIHSDISLTLKQFSISYMGLNLGTNPSFNLAIRMIGSRIVLPGFESQLHEALVVGPWVSVFIPIILSFLIQQTRKQGKTYLLPVVRIKWKQHRLTCLSPCLSHGEWLVCANYCFLVESVVGIFLLYEVLC